MSTAIAPRNRIEEYLNKIAVAHPSEAVKIAIAEMERQRAVADAAQTEYRQMSEVEFDEAGRIVKATMAGMFRLAQFYAGAMILPEHWRGKPNDCFIGLQMAKRLNCEPLAYFQNSYLVHGKPGIEAKLSTALLNTSGLILGKVRYRFEGEGKNRKCTAFVQDRETKQEVSATITWETVVAEGWDKKTGSKWLTMPEQMFCYRSATFLIRRHYPEVLMGMNTVDELEDIDDVAHIEGPARPASLEALTQQLETKEEYKETVQEQVKELADKAFLPDIDPKEPLAGLANALKECESIEGVRRVYEHYCGADSTLNQSASDAVFDACKAREVAISKESKAK